MLYLCFSLPFNIFVQHGRNIEYIEELEMVGYGVKFATSVHLKSFVYVLERKSGETTKNNVPYFLLLQGVYLPLYAY